MKISASLRSLCPNRPVLYLLLLLLTASCERRELTEELYQTAKIKVSIDWSEAALDPDNDPDGDLYRASVWLFCKEGPIFNGKSYKEYRLNSCLGGEIEVPIGHYSVLVFNNSVDEFSSYVGFRGTDRYETFEYYAKADTRSSQARNATLPALLEPDVLAAWHLDNLEITPEVVTYTRTRAGEQGSSSRASEQANSLQDVQPTRLTTQCNLQAYARQIKSVSTAQGFLQGMAGSVFLVSGQVSAAPTTVYFTLNHHTYDPGSTTDGTLNGTFNTIGPLADPAATYGLQLWFTLTAAYNGSTTWPTPPEAPYQFDITEQVLYAESHTPDLAVSLELDIKVGYGLTPDEPEITFPTVNQGSGFSAEVEEWGEEEQHELVM